MASPFVTATATLVRAVAPKMTAPEVAALLVATAEPLSDVVPGSAGAGLVDPVASLERAGGPPPVHPVTISELENMSAPPIVCDYLGLPDGPHQFVNRRYAINAGAPNELRIAVGDVAVGDLDGDDIDDGVLSIGCFNGVADHIDTVYVLRAKDRSLVELDLTEPHLEWDPFDPRQESLVDVRELSIADGSVRVKMSWTFETDARAGPTSIAFGTYELGSDGFVRTAVDITSDLTRTEALVAALNARDESGVRALLVPEAASFFDVLMSRDIEFGSGGCPVGNILSPVRFCEISRTDTPFRLSIQWVGGAEPGQRRARPVESGD
jgi:hypothetical protein